MSHEYQCQVVLENYMSGSSNRVFYTQFMHAINAVYSLEPNRSITFLHVCVLLYLCEISVEILLNACKISVKELLRQVSSLC